MSRCTHRQSNWTKHLGVVPEHYFDGECPWCVIAHMRPIIAAAMAEYRLHQDRASDDPRLVRRVCDCAFCRVCRAAEEVERARSFSG